MKNHSQDSRSQTKQVRTLLVTRISMPERDGQVTFMESEIKDSVDHVGLLELLKLSVIDLPSNQKDLLM